MATYGHDLQSETPFTLTEVTFQLSPAQLRRIASFLQHCAAEIEAGTLINGHRHLIDEQKDWSESDIIVVPLPAQM